VSSSGGGLEEPLAFGPPPSEAEAEASFVGLGPRQQRAALNKALAVLAAGPADVSASRSVGATTSVSVSTVAVVSGEEGCGKRRLAAWLPWLAPTHRLCACGPTPATRAQNLFDDGRLMEGTVFTAFRGPLLSLLHAAEEAGLLTSEAGSADEASAAPFSPQAQAEAKGEGAGYVTLRRARHGPTQQRCSARRTLGTLADAVDVLACVRALDLPQSLSGDLPLLRFVFPDRPKLVAACRDMQEQPLSPHAALSAAAVVRLTRLLVAVVTAADARAGACAPPFRFLLVLEHCERLMDPESWSLVNALRLVTAGRRRGGKRSNSSSHSSGSEAAAASAGVVSVSGSLEGTVTEFAAPGAAPKLLLVTRPLMGLAAPAEYLEAAAEATRNRTFVEVRACSSVFAHVCACSFLLACCAGVLLPVEVVTLGACSGESCACHSQCNAAARGQVSPFDASDAAAFLAHAAAQKIAALARTAARGGLLRGSSRSEGCTGGLRVTRAEAALASAAVAQAAASPDDGAELLARAAAALQLFGADDDDDDNLSASARRSASASGVTSLAARVEVSAEVGRFVAECCEGRAMLCLELVADLFNARALELSFKPNEPEAALVRARRGTSLEELPLSHHLRLRALARFHSAMGADTSADWLLLARLASAFQVGLGILTDTL
jgi:hypothetical protein